MTDSTDQPTDLPENVERHADLEPGIFRLDIEAMFGHISDADKRRQEVEQYVADLSEGLPDGSIILPTEIEKIGHADDADELLTRSEAKAMIDNALNPSRSDVRETIENAMEKAHIESLKQLSENIEEDSDIHPALREYTESETGAVVNVVDEDED